MQSTKYGNKYMRETVLYHKTGIRFTNLLLFIMV